MNYKTLKALLILVGLIGLSLPVNAQFEKKAQVGMKFLSNPVSAEAVARGTSGINLTTNSNGIFWNPALTGLITTTADVSLNYQKWIADITYNSLAASVNFEGIGVFTLSGTIVDYGDLYQTVRSNNDQGYEETGKFTPSAFQIGIGYAQKVSDRFSYGVNVKFVRQDLGSAWISTSGDSISDPKFHKELKSYDMNVPAIDIGTYYDFKYKGITFAATLTNISREVKYEQEDFPLPFAVSFGGTIAPLQFFFEDTKQHNLIVSIESNHPRDFGEKMKYALEYDYMKMIYFRTGYITNVDERGFSAGIGLRKTIANTNFRVDYAYQPAGIFGTLHYITVGIGY
jgi:hypothetical protein